MQQSLDYVSSWYQGLCFPALLPDAPASDAERTDIPDDEKIPETDDDVCKYDLIKVWYKILKKYFIIQFCNETYLFPLTNLLIF